MKESAMQLLEEIRANRKKLDQCPRHHFKINEQPPYRLNMRLTCERCGGTIDAVQAYAYATGYAAAGRDPNEIIEGFREVEDDVVCPKCGGVCGCEASIPLFDDNGEIQSYENGGWCDCEVCDATGLVPRSKALAFIDEHG